MSRDMDTVIYTVCGISALLSLVSIFLTLKGRK